MKRMIIILIIIIIAIRIFSTELFLKDEILNVSKIKGIEKILWPRCKIDKSKNERYYYVSPLADLNTWESDPIEEKMIIDGKVFEKGEKNWWYIYDIKTDKIIIKDNMSKYLGAGNGDGFFDDVHGFFIFHIRTDVLGKLIFYNLNETKKEPIKLWSLSGHKVYEVSGNSQYIAYLYATDEEVLFSGYGELDYEIRILSVKLNKYIILKPKEKGHSFEFIKWENNNTLLYREYKYFGRGDEIVKDNLRYEVKDTDFIIKNFTAKIANLTFKGLPNFDNSKIRNTLKKSEKLELLETGKEATIDCVKGNWVKVRTEKGEEGWCFSGYLEEVK